MYFFSAFGKSLHAILDLLFPPLCLGCRGLKENTKGIFCPSCLASLNFFCMANNCAKCLEPIDGKGCKEEKNHLYERMIATFEPSFSGKRLIALSRQREEFYDLMASLAICQMLNNNFPIPDIVVPIPDPKIHFLLKDYRFSFHLSKQIASLCRNKVLDLFENSTLSFLEDEFSWKNRKDISRKVILVVDVWHSYKRFQDIGKLLLEGFPEKLYGLSLMIPEEDFHPFEEIQELGLPR